MIIKRVPGRNLTAMYMSAALAFLGHRSDFVSAYDSSTPPGFFLRSTESTGYLQLSQGFNSVLNPWWPWIFLGIRARLSVDGWHKILESQGQGSPVEECRGWFALVRLVTYCATGGILSSWFTITLTRECYASAFLHAASRVDETEVLFSRDNRGGAPPLQQK